MADEVRRSGRATKGQHTKPNDEIESFRKKVGKGRRSKAAQAEEEEEETIIRCICGYIEENKKDKRAMICCDKCSAWQHNVCMGMPDDDDLLPDSYFCEQCKPHNHKGTLEAMKRGEKPWEEREARHKQEEEEEKAYKRKGGKKGKGGRPSAAKDTHESDVAPAQPATQPPTDKLEGKTKRKLPADLHVEAPSNADENALKHRKVSTPKTPKDAKLPPRRQSNQPQRRDSKGAPFQSELVDNIDDLQHESRKRAAKGLVTKFIDSTKQAVHEGKFTLPPGQTADAYGNQLGLAVEYALFLNFWVPKAEPSPLYGEKLRTIIHNVKQNPALRDSLLSGALAPNTLTTMSSDDMMRKDQKEEKAHLLKQAEKQHTLVHEEGPRIRRTHKGEEIVGEDQQATGTNESIYAGATVRPRRESEADDNDVGPDARTPHSPMDMDHPARPLVVDTRAQPADRKFSGNFDIDNAWSSVDTPSHPKYHHQASPTGGPHDAPSPTGPTNADPEIARLLHDHDDDDEPYSPKEYTEDGTVWRGTLSMPMVAEFRGAAQHVAGADLSAVHPWSSMMPPVLTIEGRIAVEKASEYLCGLQWSKTTDVTVVAVAPSEHATPDDRAQFNKLFEYFVSRQRYGVVNKSPVALVRDTYVVPLEAGAAKKPEFIELLENCTLGDDRPARLLLVTYVVKSRPDNLPPSNQTTPREPKLANSPVAHHGGPGQFMSPVAAQEGFSGPPPQPLRQGWEAARHVLGPLADAPAVVQLLQMAPDTLESSFVHIKIPLETRPELREDLGALITALQGSMGGVA